jgi:hypothetical protein
MDREGRAEGADVVGLDVGTDVGMVDGTALGSLVGAQYCTVVSNASEATLSQQRS